MGNDEVARQMELGKKRCAALVYLVSRSRRNDDVAGQWGPSERCTIFHISLQIGLRKDEKYALTERKKEKVRFC